MQNVTIAPIPVRVVTFCMYAMQFVTSAPVERSIVTKDMLGLPRFEEPVAGTTWRASPSGPGLVRFCMLQSPASF